MLRLLIIEIGPEETLYEKYIINPDNNIESISNKENRYYPKYNCCIRMKSGEEFYVVDILDIPTKITDSYSAIRQIFNNNKKGFRRDKK